MSKDNDSTMAIAWKLRAVIEKSGYVKPEYACDLVTLIVEGIQMEFGGGDLYITKPSRSDRNNSIRNEFNGKNANEICKKHQVSRATLYRIIGGNE